MESNSPLILVADDDTEDQEMLLEYFLGGGLNQEDIAFVSNGKAAIEYLHQHPLPRLVVLDLKMPIMDGQSTLMHIKGDAMLKRIPVVMYSTSTNEQDRRKCLVNGALEYFVKPSSYDEGELMANRLVGFLQNEQ